MYERIRSRKGMICAAGMAQMNSKEADEGKEQTRFTTAFRGSRSRASPETGNDDSTDSYELPTDFRNVRDWQGSRAANRLNEIQSCLIDSRWQPALSAMIPEDPSLVRAKHVSINVINVRAGCGGQDPRPPLSVPLLPVRQTRKRSLIN